MAATSQIPEKFNDYKGFVEKFKPKKTSDDCYTPELVYDAVREWVYSEYADELTVNGMPAPIIRPFYPGGDYEKAEYADGCLVLDNPPFSMYKKIVQFFTKNNIKFFLFAPYLTCFSAANIPGVCLLPVDAKITYENGACINTAFVTNLDKEYIVRSAPSLRRAVMEADAKSQDKKHLPSYVFPDNVLTATTVGKMSRMGKQLNIRRGAAHFCTALESMKKAGKKFFGGAFLVSDKKARRIGIYNNIPKDNAHEWEMSADELKIIDGLNAVEKDIVIKKLNAAADENAEAKNGSL